MVITRLKSFLRVGLKFSFSWLSGVPFSAKAIKDFLWARSVPLVGLVTGTVSLSTFKTHSQNLFSAGIEFDTDH